MRQKIIATGAALVLVSLAAVGTFASQDAVNGLEETPTVEPTATETTEATPTATEEATSTPEATATAEPTATATETGDGTATPEATATPDDEDDGGPRDIRGIPTDNPNHVDDDGDDECEKGEAAIKTTPSGNQVRVPCHAAENSDKAQKNKHSDDETDDSEDDEEGDTE
jgi:hypothetical protein